MSAREGIPRMKREQARRVLERIGVVRDLCDLDLLLFFVRHPRALLTSDQIASLLGYDVKRIGDSLDVLLAAKLLTRSQNPAHAARMYVFSVGGPNGGWLPSLIDLVSAREGRLAMREVLAESSRGSGKSIDEGDQGRDEFHRAG